MKTLADAEKDLLDLVQRNGLLDTLNAFMAEQAKMRLVRDRINAEKAKRAVSWKLLFVAVFASLLLVGCQDTFRYECQDPQNWHKPDCNPPKCEADGTCTKYLLKDSNEN